MTLSFAWEPFDRLYNDGLAALAQQDWQEIGTNHTATPLDIDWDYYRQISLTGTYRAIAARRNGRLVGYNSFFVNRHTRHRGQIFAQGDVLYLLPDQRRGGVGVRFLQESEALLRSWGAVKVRYDSVEHVRLGANGKTLGDLLQHLGYTLEAKVFTKLL